MAVNIILGVLLIIVGAVIGWRLAVIDNKLDWILDAVTDYEELVKSLEDELTKDDWRTVTIYGKTYNREQLKEYINFLKNNRV